MATKQRIDVFISSTSIDLPEYRKAVQDAILSLGLYPSGMEHWPVAGENPVDLCRKMVFDAEIYLGIYAHRYGWRPDGDTSITEMEYDWAKGRKIPQLCFIIDDRHPWPQNRVEDDTAAREKLNAFKQRVMGDLTVAKFTTPEDLKAKVLAALAPYSQLSTVEQLHPYLRGLHTDCLQSGLLRVMDSRSSDPTQKRRPITVDQIYTPLNVERGVWRDDEGKILPIEDVPRLDKAEKEDRQQTPMTAMEAANQHGRLVLLGDPGSGKSTFVNFLALCLTGHLLEPEAGWLDRLKAQAWTHPAALPILVTLRDFAQTIPHDLTEGTAGLIWSHIAGELGKRDCAGVLNSLRAAMDKGRAFVFFDGLDEVPPSRRTLVRDAVADFMNSAHPDNRYLVTCRKLSYGDTAWHIPDTNDETIAPFDSDQIEHFISTWYTAMEAVGGIKPDLAQQRVSDLTEALGDSKLQAVASNPMLLTVMALVHNHTGALPREAARLYEECVKLLMLRWRPHDARTLLEELDVREDDLYRMLWEIAYDAHNQQADREGAADIPETAIIGIANRRLNDRTKAELFCEYIEKRAGLLVGRGQDSYGWRVYSFPHRTFQEYLAGCYVASDRFTRRLSELARRGTWDVALLLATGHLVFNKGDIATPLDGISLMLPERFQPTTDADWRVVWLAGDMLKLIGLANVENDSAGKEVLPRVRGRLAELVGGGHLPPVERAAAGRTLSVLGDPRKGIGVIVGASRGTPLPDIDWVEIPAGTFHMGGDPDAYNAWDGMTIDLPYDFWMARYPVTCAQYAAFMADGGYANPDYWTEAGWAQKEAENWTQPRWWDDPTENIANHPVNGVSWYEADAFCRWLATRYVGEGLRPSSTIGNFEIRLPTEAEWEKAARYPHGWKFPWGDDYISGYANLNEQRTGAGSHYLARTSPGGMYPLGASPGGIHDLAGNVWEWCLSKWDSNYHWPEENDPDGTNILVLRGGSWDFGVINSRAASRGGEVRYLRNGGIGFRVCAVPAAEG